MRSLSRFLCPKAPVPPDVVGKWERHWLSPLPHASSFDRPTSRLPAIILADGAASAVAVTSSFRPFPARRSLVTKTHVAPTCGVAPSGICLWIKRIPGITLHLENKGSDWRRRSKRNVRFSGLRPCYGSRPIADLQINALIFWKGSLRSAVDSLYQVADLNGGRARGRTWDRAGLVWHDRPSRGRAGDEHATALSRSESTHEAV